VLGFLAGRGVTKADIKEAFAGDTDAMFESSR
jgi:hypothetical protein